ncbi:HD domain-containing protein [Veronia pacifica]|uniref:Phosphohydrolase n=1 Tax=Veronia pacifica TaxID=1080227 RepID=A0A1C3E7N0_9GAMM|nr:HD domain-containing protein [Veronia pacifica]ODA29214.1 phosphohydrolase [Veronia pacifica]
MTESDFLVVESQLEQFVTRQHISDPTHDLNHVKRVVKNAEMLWQKEGADRVITITAAWLHDCVTFAKNHPERHLSSVRAADKAIAFLSELGFTDSQMSAVHHAICAHSFSANITPTTLEAKIVQDADRLDALGAIGIARCIQVGTVLQRPLYQPLDPLCEKRDADDSQYTLDHFYTKLLSLPATMQTDTAREEAQRRCQFMRTYLSQFKEEVV